MRIRKKSTSIALALLIGFALFAGFFFVNAYSASTGGKLDLFTQKVPFSGRGQNAASDAFSPGTTVEISALLTYNDFPISQWLVTFGVVGPPNPFDNITLIYTATTDGNGLAHISFRIPLAEETTFGQWIIYGNSEITTEIVTSDLVIFNVGWIVDIISIKTINQNNAVSSEFTRGSQIGVEVGLRNIAMVEKNVTLALTVLDLLRFYVNSRELSNIVVPANGTITYVSFNLIIPDNSTLGGAIIYINAYSAPIINGGVSYCPQRTSSFSIVEIDIAISMVTISRNLVFVGEEVYVDVTTVNNGQYPESFSVSVYSNETLLGTTDITALQPVSNIKTRFTWDTSSFREGNYSIRAFASPAPGEVDLLDNLFVDGIVQVKSRNHDIAVLAVVPSASLVYKGSDVSISVLVRNNGHTAESFGLTVYYDNFIINVMPVENLDAGTQRTLVFNWNTNAVPRGNYTIKAYAEPVPNETHTEDNTYTDGTVTVTAPPSQYMFNEYLFNLILLLLLILLFAVLLLWLIAKRRKRKHEETFYSGWTAWYYCNDPRGRFSKVKNPSNSREEI